MKNIIPILLFLVFLSCGEPTSTNTESTVETDSSLVADQKQMLEDRAKLIDDIAYLEGDLSSSPDGKMNTTLAKELIEKSVLYATTYKDDPRSAPYLFRAADVAKEVGMPDRAIELWQTLRKTYPDHNKAPQSLFLEANSWENDFNNYEKARDVYLEFLRLYPEHPLSGQVKKVLRIFGVSPEEMDQAVQKK